MRSLALIFFFLGMVAACSAAIQDDEIGRGALMEFFVELNDGHYTQAVTLYGGSYETLAGMNPDIDPTNLAALWERGCKLNGFQCLAVRMARFKEQDGATFVYTVEFRNLDGGVFVQGPCCGASETEMPPVSQFEYRVLKQGERYLVLDMPVFIP